MIHAYLLLYFKHDPSAKEIYPRMVAAYRSVIPEPQLNEVHHQEMATSSVGEIAIALREYGRSLGIKVDDSVYTELAWGGLDYRSNGELTEGSKQRFQRRIVAEQVDAPFHSIFSAVAPRWAGRLCRKTYQMALEPLL